MSIKSSQLFIISKVMNYILIFLHSEQILKLDTYKKVRQHNATETYRSSVKVPVNEIGGDMTHSLQYETTRQ